jgi:hypothetical protein
LQKIAANAAFGEMTMMTIDDLLYDLRKAKPDAVVMFDFCNCAPTTIGSWRGIYAEPALGWIATGYSGKGKTPTVADLIAELERAIDGREYTGWKGGEFRYTGSDTLHIDNNGESTNTELVRAENDDWRVVLHTRREG